MSEDVFPRSYCLFIIGRWTSRQIEVMDYDHIGRDELIGKTVIDLEDRWFDTRWQVCCVCVVYVLCVLCMLCMLRMLRILGV